MKKSTFLSLNWQDFLKGLVVAVGGGIVAIVAPSIESGNFTFNWTIIWHTAAAAGLSYIAKNLFSPTPKKVEIDPSKTSVVDEKTKETIVDAGDNVIDVPFNNQVYVPPTK